MRRRRTACRGRGGRYPSSGNAFDIRLMRRLVSLVWSFSDFRGMRSFLRLSSPYELPRPLRSISDSHWDYMHGLTLSHCCQVTIARKWRRYGHL